LHRKGRIINTAVRCGGIGRPAINTAVRCGGIGRPARQPVRYVYYFCWKIVTNGPRLGGFQIVVIPRPHLGGITWSTFCFITQSRRLFTKRANFLV